MLASDPFQGRTLEPVSPKRADVRAHAGAGDGIYLDAVLFQHLDNPDMRQPLRAAGGKRKAHAAARDLTSEAIDMQAEPAIRP